MSDSTVEELRAKASFENRIASARVGGERICVQGRVAGRKESAPKGTPWVRISVGGNSERELYDTVAEMEDRFEELVEEYDLEE